jgi:hypothetical protein
MHFESAYPFIGRVDSELLVRAVEALGADAWFECVERQQTFHPHRSMLTILFLYDQDGRHTDATEWRSMAFRAARVQWIDEVSHDRSPFRSKQSGTSQ